MCSPVHFSGETCRGNRYTPARQGSGRGFSLTSKHRRLRKKPPSRSACVTSHHFAWNWPAHSPTDLFGASAFKFRNESPVVVDNFPRLYHLRPSTLFQHLSSLPGLVVISLSGTWCAAPSTLEVVLTHLFPRGGPSPTPFGPTAQYDHWPSRPNILFPVSRACLLDPCGSPETHCSKVGSHLPGGILVGSLPSTKKVLEP